MASLHGTETFEIGLLLFLRNFCNCFEIQFTSH